MTGNPTDAPPPATSKPKRPRKAKSTLEMFRESLEGAKEAMRATEFTGRPDNVQIPAETDPASAFRADMQLRKAIAQRRLEALEARRTAVDGDRHDKKSMIDSEATAKKHRLDATAGQTLAEIDDESASVIRELAGIGAALDASQPPGAIFGGMTPVKDGAAHTGVGGYIGLSRPAPADTQEAMDDAATDTAERLAAALEAERNRQ